MPRLSLVIPWQRVFNVKSQKAILEAGPALAVFVVCFAVNLPLGVVQRIQLGYQEGFATSLWESAGRVLGLAGLLLVIYLKAGLTWLVLAMAGAPALAWLLNSLVEYGFRRPWLRPRFQNFHSASAPKVLHTGSFFFMLQMGLTLIYGSDNLIITQFLGPEAVTQYAIPYQMFSLSWFSLIWSSHHCGPPIVRLSREATNAWVQKALKRSLKTILLSTGIVSLFLVIFGNQLLNIWVGPKVSSSLLLNLGLGFWMILLTFGSTMTILLNAANIFRFQIIFVSLTLIFSLVFKCIFISYFGLSGIIWGTILAYVLFLLIPYSIFVKKTFYTGFEGIRDYN